MVLDAAAAVSFLAQRGEFVSVRNAFEIDGVAPPCDFSEFRRSAT